VSGQGYHKPHLQWQFPKEFLDLIPADVPPAMHRAFPASAPPIGWHECAECSDTGSVGLSLVKWAECSDRGSCCCWSGLSAAAEIVVAGGVVRVQRQMQLFLVEWAECSDRGGCRWWSGQSEATQVVVSGGVGRLQRQR
jgi:hypothetical protein